jgi:hypothetical protein
LCIAALREDFLRMKSLLNSLWIDIINYFSYMKAFIYLNVIFQPLIHMYFLKTKFIYNCF